MWHRIMDTLMYSLLETQMYQLPGNLNMFQNILVYRPKFGLLLSSQILRQLNKYLYTIKSLAQTLIIVQTITNLSIIVLLKNVLLEVTYQNCSK